MVKYLPAGTICWSELGLADWLDLNSPGAGAEPAGGARLYFNYLTIQISDSIIEPLAVPALALNKYIDINIKIWSPD